MVILDGDKKLIEQDLLDETKAILSIIYKDFVCDDEKKKELSKIQQEYLNKKSLNFKKEIESNEKIINEEKKELVKEENGYVKFKNIIKRLLSRLLGGDKNGR